MWLPFNSIVVTVLHPVWLTWAINPSTFGCLSGFPSPAAPQEAFPGQGGVDLPSPGDLKYWQLYLFSFIGSVGVPLVSK